MGINVQAKYMDMPKECFCFDFFFGTARGAIMFAVATVNNYFLQPRQAEWVYLS